MISDNDRPVRQFIVRSGKVIPISQALQSASTRDLRSLEISTVRSANSLTSKFSQDGTVQPPQPTKFFDRRVSSGLRDLEAQREGAGTREANATVLYHSEERRRKSRSHVGSQTREAERRVSASSQKITASLQKAYKGTPALETETVDIPPTLGSKSTEIRTIVRKKKSDPQIRASSYPRLREASTEPTMYGEPRKQKSNPPNHSRNSSFDPVGFAVSTNSIQLPPPVLSIDTRSSLSQSKRPKNMTRTSFLSMSTSRASSDLSKEAYAKAEDTSSLSENHNIHNISPLTTSDGDMTPRPRLKIGRSRSTGIGFRTSRVGEASFINSATVSMITTPSVQRDSMMSNNSVATFASSDMSSTWTVGNAQPVTILPSVGPTSAPPLPDLQKLKSKYGRYPKIKEKALPVLPRSPLSR